MPTRYPSTGIFAYYPSPVTTGDTSAAIVYRLTDSSGCIWRSAPQIVLNGLRADNVEGVSENASGQWLVIPTLRHLMSGTSAQIEIYLGTVDLQLFYVVENDPTIDYIEFSPNGVMVTGGVMPTITAAIAAAPVGETLYTTGGGIPADPPPQMECAVAWRNRVFGCFQNTIYPSQEFAVGLGLQWSTLTRVEWHEGTGDILGVCPVDWNYLAVFKKDAIGILSGAGPDGLGHGNYIVQTLSTKAGCTNVRSLVNGPDGCYYQDAATGRMMLLSPDMQVREAMPGAFDTFTTSTTVTSALHVEARRELWFTVENTILVLDYKHKPASAPLGQVYTWPLNLSASPVGMAIVSGAPVLMLATNDTGAQVASQYYDQNVATTKTAVNRIIETGDIAPIGLQRQCNIDRVQVLGEYQSAHTCKITTYPDFATSGTATQVDVTAAPLQVSTRPPSCMRVQAIRIRVEDVLYSTTYGAGSKLVGFGLVVQDAGRLVDVNVGRII